MQYSALVFVLYINSLVSVGRTAAFSVNINTPLDYRGTTTDYIGAVSSDIYLSTVSYYSIVNVREGREDDLAHAHNVIIHYSCLTQTRLKCFKSVFMCVTSDLSFISCALFIAE
jgi:hypothetical protein